MTTDNIERLHYYQRQYVGALDFEDQQTYHRDMRRRLNLAHHTWGIVVGLELAIGANGVDINITPGMAIDGYGREIVMFIPTQLDPALFQLFRGIDYHTVCLEYTETLTRSPQAGYGQCDQTNQFGRVGENFNVVVEEPSRDNITVNGQAIVFPIDQTDPKNPISFFTNIKDPEDKPVLPPQSPSSGPENQLLPLDESVPYQELPVDDPTVPTEKRWLIPLGRVRWDGTSGQQRFAGDKLHPVTKEDGRHYIGSVASRILTPARNLIVRDRNTDVPLPAFDPNKKPPPVPDGVVMIIEGTLQVERLLDAKDDIQIHGHALDFRDIGDDDIQTDDKRLYTISRIDGGGAGGIDLRLKIGVDNKGSNRFVVGTADTNDLFTVDDAGNAYPAGVLDFGSQPRQMIALWSSQDKSQQNTIGIQAVGSPADSPPTFATTYFRSSNDFFWYKGGIHSKDPGSPGKAGSILMYLNAIGLNVSGNLAVNGGLIVNGGLSVNGGLTVTGPLSANGGLTVAKATNLNGSLTVAGATDLQDRLTVTGLTNLNNSLTVTGATDLQGSLTVTGLLSANGGLTVTGATNLNGSLTVTGLINLNNGLTVTGLLSANGGLTVTGATDLQGSLTVAGLLSANGGLTVTGLTNLNNGLTVTGATDLQGSLTVAGATDLQSSLTVTGLTNLNNGLTVAGATDLQGSLAVTGPLSANGGLTVTGATDLNGGLTIAGAVNLQGLNNGLDVTGSHVKYISTVNNGFEVTLGYISAPGAPTHHDSDSIHGIPNLWLDAQGTVFIKQGFQTPAMDGAEHFPFSEPVESGDVVVLSAEGGRSIKPAESEFDTSVVGVVSTDPAFILGGPKSAGEIEAMRQVNAAVALIGTVLCKVDADRGSIHKGDLLTTSPTKGHAQKVTDPSKAAGAVLGKAMEDLEKGQGLITMLMMLA